MTTPDQIVVENLDRVFTSDKGRQNVQALQAVDLRVRPGQFFSVLGPSGCGKSTLLRIIGGLIEPSGGQVTMHGNATPHDAQRAKEIGFVFQSPGLLAWKTVAENIELPLRVNKRASRPSRHTTADLLELVGLAAFAGAYPHQLSGGMQQRVAIARAGF